jgi:hypothetical protein
LPLLFDDIAAVAYLFLFLSPISRKEKHNMKADQAWQAASGQLQMEMPKASYDTWVKEAEFLSYEDGQFIIGVPNTYARLVRRTAE